MISNHASDLLSTALEEEIRISENIPVKQNWKERMKNVHQAWDRNRQIFWDSRLERECPDFNVCASCFNELHHYVICCTNHWLDPTSCLSFGAKKWSDPESYRSFWHKPMVWSGILPKFLLTPMVGSGILPTLLHKPIVGSGILSKFVHIPTYVS